MQDSQDAITLNITTKGRNKPRSGSLEALLSELEVHFRLEEGYDTLSRTLVKNYFCEVSIPSQSGLLCQDYMFCWQGLEKDGDAKAFDRGEIEEDQGVIKKLESRVIKAQRDGFGRIKDRLLESFGDWIIHQEGTLENRDIVVNLVPQVEAQDIVTNLGS